MTSNNLHVYEHIITAHARYFCNLYNRHIVGIAVMFVLSCWLVIIRLAIDLFCIMCLNLILFYFDTGHCLSR